MSLPSEHRAESSNNFESRSFDYREVLLLVDNAVLTFHFERIDAFKSNCNGADDAEFFAGRRSRAGCCGLLRPTRRGRRGPDLDRGHIARASAGREHAANPAFVWRTGNGRLDARRRRRARSRRANVLADLACGSGARTDRAEAPRSADQPVRPAEAGRENRRTDDACRDRSDDRRLRAGSRKRPTRRLRWNRTPRRARVLD